MPMNPMLVDRDILKMEQEFFMNIEDLGVTSIEVALYWGPQLIRVKSVSMNEEFTLDNGQKLARIENGYLVFNKNINLSATVFAKGQTQKVIPNDFSKKGLLLKHGYAVQVESGEFSFHINPKVLSLTKEVESIKKNNLFTIVSCSLITLVLSILILK